LSRSSDNPFTTYLPTYLPTPRLPAVKTLFAMAPSRITDSPVSELSESNRPTLYLLDDFYPAVHAYCEENFNTIDKSHPAHKNWRQGEYLLMRSSRLTAEDIKSCPNLRAIGKQGVGIEKIDAEACATRGIPILNTPGVNAQAVAEVVLALTMTVARQIGTIVGKQSHGILVPKEKCSSLPLHRKTIEILGMGNIGKAVARIFRGAFDAEIIAYDPFLPAGAWGEIPHVRAESVEQVLVASDMITVHMPLTPQTANLIGYAEMQRMKNTAILINAARGGIINEKRHVSCRPGRRSRLIKHALSWSRASSPCF
jgi:phosphoglycerate dehydrogenase-like enzyme